MLEKVTKLRKEQHQANCVFFDELLSTGIKVFQNILSKILAD